MVDKFSIKEKTFPHCAGEAFLIIRSNYNRVNKQELAHLAYQYIFNYEYNPDQMTWIRKNNSMQTLQCVDCIVNYFEGEKESNIRDFMFDLLFGDIYQIENHILILLSSYAISLESKNTLECLSKWIIMNIGNEIIQNIFHELVKDHFLLTYESAVDSQKPKDCLVKLCDTCPLFSSLFIAIVLDMQAKLGGHEKCLKKLFDLFEIWISKNKLLPLLAYKSNISHACSYLLNPLPSLFYVTVIYPFKSFVNSFDTLVNNTHVKLIKLNKMKLITNSKINEESTLNEDFQAFEKNQSTLEELSFRIHFVTLKLIKELANNLSGEKLKLLNLKHVESIIKQIDELTTLCINKSNMNLNLTLRIRSSFNRVLADCLDRLAQLLEICWKHDFVTCSKLEIKQLYLKSIKYKHESNSNVALLENISNNNNNNSINLMEIILNI